MSTVPSGGTMFRLCMCDRIAACREHTVASLQAAHVHHVRSVRFLVAFSPIEVGLIHDPRRAVAPSRIIALPAGQILPASGRKKRNGVPPFVTASTALRSSLTAAAELIDTRTSLLLLPRIASSPCARFTIPNSIRRSNHRQIHRSIDQSLDQSRNVGLLSVCVNSHRESMLLLRPERHLLFASNLVPVPAHNRKAHNLQYRWSSLDPQQPAQVLPSPEGVHPPHHGPPRERASRPSRRPRQAQVVADAH